MNMLLILLPFALICWFLPFPFAAVVSRSLLLISVSGGLAKIRCLRRTELRWIQVLGLFLAASAISAIFSVEPSLSLTDFARQAYIAVFSVLLALAARDYRERILLARTMIIPALLGMVAVLFLYWTFGSGMSNEALHVFKSTVSEEFPALSMNPIAGFIVLTCFLSIPAITKSRVIAFVLAVVFTLALALTGARATILALPLALVLFWIFRFFSRRPTSVKVIGLVLIVAICFALTVNFRVPAAALDKLDDITTHRVYLWEAALEQFSDHPLLGAGADSWRLELPILSAPSREISDRFSRLPSGAYHNAYLAFMAERGLLVLVPALLIMWFVLRSSLDVFRHRNLFDTGDRAFATLAPVMALFITLRQMAECSGLMAYANGAADFASFAVVSIVVALAGDVEDVSFLAPQPQRLERFKRAFVVNS